MFCLNVHVYKYIYTYNMYVCIYIYSVSIYIHRSILVSKKCKLEWTNNAFQGDRKLGKTILFIFLVRKCETSGSPPLVTPDFGWWMINSSYWKMVDEYPQILWASTQFCGLLIPCQVDKHWTSGRICDELKEIRKLNVLKSSNEILYWSSYPYHISS